MFPGMTVTAGRVLVTVGAAIAPNFFNQGVGFLANGRIPVDTAAPTGNVYLAGIRRNASGAIYGTTALDSAGPDVYLHGLRLSTIGQLVYADAAPASFFGGNPITATGALAVNTT